jgi:hypothetical protein
MAAFGQRTNPLTRESTAGASGEDRAQQLMIVDVSRCNGIDWDAVIPCEMLRVYKPLPDAYRRAAAFWLSSCMRS